MAVKTDLEPLLSRLYEAALDPGLWPQAWAEATAAGGVAAPTLVVMADNDGAAPLAAPGWGRHAVKPVLPVVVQAAAPYARPERAAPPPVTEAEREVAAQLTAHLRRAVRLRARLATAEAVQAASAAALQAADTGVILVTAGGRIVHADPAARRLADMVGLHLDSRRGALQALDPAATRHLQGLVHDAAAGGLGGDMLMRAADGSAVALAVCRMTPPDGGPAEDEAERGPGQALLTLRHLGQVPNSPRRVAALFGLTRAEADVAIAVAAGQQVAAVAAGRGVSASTVQAQVRSAMGKAGVPGLPELSQLLSRLG
jgi:DNA-binding CsgD family transcriptional regulator